MLDGMHVRYFGDHDAVWPQFVDTDSSIVAVSESGNHIQYFARVTVYDYATGSVRCRFVSSGVGALDAPSGLRIVHAGQRVLVTDQVGR